MKLEGVSYQKQGEVARVVLDRPECLNAMNLAMHESLKQVWDDFEQDDSLRVAVIEGRGERAFSVGQDLKELAVLDSKDAPASSFGSRGRPGYPRLTERFDLTKPVIAKVSGYAYGGGFELALACDIIVAADNALFALPEAKLGLIAGAGGVFRLLRQMPHHKALGYLMTGRSIAAEQAERFGLINQVCSQNELESCVQQWVDDILRAAPWSVRTIKQIANNAGHLPLEQAFAAHYSCEEARRQSSDRIEGPKAFAQKREPKWSQS